MFFASKLQSPKPPIFGNPIHHHGFVDTNLSFRSRYTLRLASPALRFANVSDSVASYSPPSQYSNPQESSDPSVSSRLTSSVGQPPLKLSQWTLTQNHFVFLNVFACVVSLCVLPRDHRLNFHLDLGFPTKRISPLGHTHRIVISFDSNCSMKIWIFHHRDGFSLADSNFSIMAILCCNSNTSGWFLNILLLQILKLID